MKLVGVRMGNDIETLHNITNIPRGVILDFSMTFDMHPSLILFAIDKGLKIDLISTALNSDDTFKKVQLIDEVKSKYGKKRKK